MKLLIIPSWYPTKLHQESGSFFRDRAHILKNNGLDVTIAAPIVHSLKNIFSYNNISGVDFFLDADLPTYLNETITQEIAIQEAVKPIKAFMMNQVDQKSLQMFINFY